MGTLWPIPKEAREELEDGEHVKLTIPNYGSVVIGFEEFTNDKFTICDWEIENGWKR